jgi:hypothetical protein
LSVVVCSVIWLNVWVKASSSKLVSSQKFFEFLITANSRHLMLFSNNLPSLGVLIFKKKTHLPGLSFLVFSKTDWLGPGIW